MRTNKKIRKYTGQFFHKFLRITIFPQIFMVSERPAKKTKNKKKVIFNFITTKKITIFKKSFSRFFLHVLRFFYVFRWIVVREQSPKNTLQIALNTPKNSSLMNFLFFDPRRSSIGGIRMAKIRTASFLDRSMVSAFSIIP